MNGNTFGTLFRLTTFGESHGPGIGGTIDGCPPNLPLDESCIQVELDKRKPGGNIASTARKEDDHVEILSGVLEGKTTGTPIGFLIRNTDHRSRDYSNVKDIFRPGHADMSYTAKFGIRDYRGGGRASGRETACRVAGGAIAEQLLQSVGITVTAATVELGGIAAETMDFDNAEGRAFFACDDAVIAQWEERIRSVKKQGDTVGGVVEVRAHGVPAGLGEPVFDKLDARLAYAFMSVGAVKAVEIGAGVSAARLLGSQNNDPMTPEGFLSNNAGGILGGISSGQDIIVRAAIKPIPSIAQPQRTITMSNEATEITIGGRHDISAIPRVVPVLKAMLRLSLADMVLLQRRCAG